MTQGAKAPRYQIPTHLHVPDKIDIPLFGVTISLTIRQGMIFFFGLSIAFNVWNRTASWQATRLPGGSGGLGTLLHWGLPALLALITFLLAMGKMRGRAFETWGIILLHYLITPRIFVWHSVAAEHLENIAQRSTEEETGTLMDTLDDEEDTAQ